MKESFLVEFFLTVGTSVSCWLARINGSSFRVGTIFESIESFLGVLDLSGLELVFRLFGILAIVFGLFGDLKRFLLWIASFRSFVPGRPQWYKDGESGHCVGWNTIKMQKFSENDQTWRISASDGFEYFLEPLRLIESRFSESFLMKLRSLIPLGFDIFTCTPTLYLTGTSCIRFSNFGIELGLCISFRKFSDDA